MRDNTVGNDNLLNLQNVADMLGVVAHTVRHYVNHKGLPVLRRGSKGQAWEFDKQAVLEWHFANTKPDENNESFDEARTRKMRAEASMAELEYSKRKSELVEVKAVADIVAGEYGIVRARFLNMAKKLCPMLQGLTIEEMQEVVDSEVNEVLAELQEDAT